jgi:2-polyprenyl-3-methyl-5-hydroxy-6-metoxy-1,4-benzoquinol methylase
MEKDNENYWIERHRNYIGDVRSVGNMGKDISANLAGYEQKIKMLRNALLSRCATLHGMSILEVGCGIGMMAPDLINGGAKYTGLDISSHAIEQAKTRAPEGNFICSNAYGYRLQQDFDAVFCTDVLVHLVVDDNWIRALQDMKRHLKRDGTIIIKEVIYEDRRTPSSHVVSRSWSEYLNACREIGLGMQPIDGIPGFFALKIAENNFQADEAVNA